MARKRGPNGEARTNKALVNRLAAGDRSPELVAEIAAALGVEWPGTPDSRMTGLAVRDAKEWLNGRVDDTKKFSAPAKVRAHQLGWNKTDVNATRQSAEYDAARMAKIVRRVGAKLRINDRFVGPPTKAQAELIDPPKKPPTGKTAK